MSYENYRYIANKCKYDFSSILYDLWNERVIAEYSRLPLLFNSHEFKDLCKMLVRYNSDKTSHYEKETCFTVTKVPIGISL